MIDLLMNGIVDLPIAVRLKGNSKRLSGDSPSPFGTQNKALGEFRLWSRIPQYLGIGTIEFVSH